MPKLSNQLILERRLKKNNSYAVEPFCVKCKAVGNVKQCKALINNEDNPCHKAHYNFNYELNRKVKPDVQEFCIEAINERGEKQFVKLDEKKRKDNIWFVNDNLAATKFIERDTVVIIDYLLSERRKGTVAFKEVEARPLNAWRKEGKKSKAVELNLSVKGGQVSILSNENEQRFVGGQKNLQTQTNEQNSGQVVTPRKNGKLDKMIKQADKKLKPKLYVNGSSSVNSKLVAPSPKETLLSLRRPYWTIDDMPFEYVLEKVYDWITSLTDCILEPVSAMDDNGKPIMETYTYGGETRTRPKTAYQEKYVYKNVPTLTGLAMALGISAYTLNNYLKNNGNNEPSGNHTRHSNVLITPENTPMDSLIYQMYGNSIYVSGKYEKDYSIELIQRARAEVDNYHEKRLGLNENVSGSMMYLFNSRALENGGTWSNNHSVTVEAGQSLLGRVMTEAELDRLSASSKDERAVVDIEFEDEGVEKE